MSVKCEGCVKEVKPQVVKQVVVNSNSRRGGKQRPEQAWCKNIDKKDCPTFHPPDIQPFLGLWDGNTKTTFIPVIG